MSSQRSFRCIKHVGIRPKDDQDNHCREMLCQLVRDVGCFYEICAEKLYLVYLAKDEDAQAFCEHHSQDAKSPFIFRGIHNERFLNYEPFHKDFGPFNLAATHQFCSRLKICLDTQTYRDPDKYIVVVLDDKDTKTKLNVTLLVAIAGMVLLNLTDQQIIQRLNFFMMHKGKIGEVPKDLVFREKKKFSDVSGNQTFMNLTLEDCISAFYAAKLLKFYDYYEFDPTEYLFYETVMSGDLNWIVPGKILAFAGPSDNRIHGYFHHKHPPSFYYHYFKDHNVTTVIRLNEPEYDSSGFQELGFDHYDLIFADGYPPTSTIAEKFIKIVDEAKGAVAVHCYAGIGRTGTLIAAYLMARYDFTPNMAIAWTRICRPGSVIGEQQDWLCKEFICSSVNKSSSKPTKGRRGKLAGPLINNVKLDHDEKSEKAGKTSYAAAEKQYGQARALMLAKKQRENYEKPCTRNSVLLRDVTETEAAPQGSQKNDTNIILNLGKTIPLMLNLMDFEGLKCGENPKYYRLKDGKYEWKIKFPEPGYVLLKHEFRSDLQAELASHVKARKFREPNLTFVYDPEETIENTKVESNGVVPRLKPMAIFSLNVCSQY